MLKIFDQYRKIIIPSLGVALFMIAGAITMFMTSSPKPVVPQVQQVQAVPVNSQPSSSSQPEQEPQPEPQVHEDWFAYVTGAVHKPGVYKLPENPRVFHAIESAGGMTQDADRTGINLAEKILSDGMHIHIETLEEKAKREKQEAAKLAAQQVQRSIQPAGIKAPESVMVPGIPATRQVSCSNLVDINHASEHELTRLKGVGPAIAKRIIQFRNNMGPFRTPEDLLQVRGIGPKTLEKMRPQLMFR